MSSKAAKRGKKQSIVNENKHSTEIVTVDEIMGKRMDTISHQVTDIPQAKPRSKLLG